MRSETFFSSAIFQTFSKLPIPEGYEKPEHDLEYYKAINKKYVPGI